MEYAVDLEYVEDVQTSSNVLLLKGAMVVTEDAITVVYAKDSEEDIAGK